MRDLLMGRVPRYEVPAHPQNIEGQASGILVGGNICTFAPNLGTQADATLGRDLILFIEEVGESMHNVDRQFNILAMNGVLDRCKGVILGEFDGCGSEFSYESIEAMLRQYIEKYNIPLLCGFPAGHGDVNLPLVMGAPVTIDVRSDGATLQFDIDGQRQVVNTADITTPVSTPVATRMRLAGKHRDTLIAGHMRRKRHRRQRVKSCFAKRHDGKKRTVHHGESDVLEMLRHAAQNDLAKLVFDLKHLKTR